MRVKLEAPLFQGDMRLISVIMFLVVFVRGAILVSLLPIYGAHTLGLTPDIIGIAISAHYITDTALKVMIGYLLDRFSARVIVQVSILIALLGVYCLPFADQAWMFIGAAALYGIGMSPVWIVCLTRVSPEHRATHMGYLYTLWLAALGGGPILCNILLDYSNDRTYQLLLILSALAFVLSLFMHKSPSREHHAIPLRTQLAVLRDRIGQMKLLLPGMILQTLGASMLVPILPLYASHELGLSGAQYSILLIAGGVCAVGGLIPMGRLSDRHGGRRWFLVCGFSSFALGLYILAWGLSFWYCLGIAFFLGLSYAALLPSWNAMLAAYVPPKQEGIGWGLLSTFEGIGVMIGPVVGGVIALWGGESSVFWASAAIFAAIGILYATMKQNGA
ncbi:MFS transporter [Paenibacillus sp. HB172176]|uniref:MFS transporter n=1 Tax=Paenibacillus sp. HB172176 TaxID=2493690 RepID=UPI00143BCF82|nr:MFS transporter [Paenibacillus sp. HB172176]